MLSTSRAYIKKNGIPIALSFSFFILYAILSIIRHNHFLSAWDLAVVDQITWKYSRFMPPITTIHAYSGTSIFSDHIEFIYLLLSPIYWILNDAKTLIIAQSFFISVSVFPIYLLAKKYKVSDFLNPCMCISYLMFYGIQTAVWNDVHSIVFGASLLPWFVYFLEMRNLKWSLIFFLLAISCKEDVAFLTLILSSIYFIFRRDKKTFLFISLSALYLFLAFVIYYPHFTSGYRFEDQSGYFTGLNLENFWNTPDKQQSIFYSFAWFGFLPIFSPFYLVPAIADFAHYFLLGTTVTTAQGIYLHYRVTLASLLVLPTILTISKFKVLNKWYLGIYLLIFALGITYHLHLPLTYLSKSWFWTTPSSVRSINKIIGELPKNASVVSEVNIISHVGHRREIYTLWAETKNFNKNSPCGKLTCPWLRWDGKPKFLIADTSSNWDIRQLFQNNEDFNSALASAEKEGVIKTYKQEGTTKLFTVLKNPKEVN